MLSRTVFLVHSGCISTNRGQYVDLLIESAKNIVNFDEEIDVLKIVIVECGESPTPCSNHCQNGEIDVSEEHNFY